MRKVAIAALAASAIASGATSAYALKKLNESGSFDCSCKNGSGSCTFESSTDNTSCYKGPESSCTGTCSLTLTPNKTGAAIKGEAVTGGAKTLRKARKQ